MDSHQGVFAVGYTDELGSSGTRQVASSRNWVYPSEQMFFNAMRRKGWTPEEDDMKSVVSIHNAVNERCWREILAYEAMHARCARGPRPAFCIA